MVLERWLSLTLLALPCVAPATEPATAPGPAPRPHVVVASKNFAESRLLGELMTLMLRAHTDLEVEHRANLGGTKVCFDALLAGRVDLYAEYTGTAWSIQLHEERRISDPLETFLLVQARFRERFDLEWLPPFGLSNGYALAMDRARAEALGIRTISDLLEHQDELRAAFSIEFSNREDGYLGLSRFYGLELAETRSMEHGLAYEAVTSGATDVIDVYTTDGKLRRYDLCVLEDDRGFFPPYDAAPLARRGLLEEHPEVREVLERLAFRIPDETMVALNHAVEEEGRDFVDVARGFLVAEGLIAGDGTPEEHEQAAERAGFVPFFLARWRTTLGLVFEHVRLTLVAVLLASLLAIPLGIACTRRPTLERIGLGAAGVIQTIPSLALLAFLIPLPWLGLSARSAVVALLLNSLLPILRNTFAGVRGVDATLIDAARGLGLTERQILLRVQLPLATPTIMAGIRTATVIGIGVATLAAFIGAGGLGEPIVEGLYLNDTRLILSGALPAALLALGADWLLGHLEQALTPRGMR